MHETNKRVKTLNQLKKKQEKSWICRRRKKHNCTASLNTEVICAIMLSLWIIDLFLYNDLVVMLIPRHQCFDQRSFDLLNLYDTLLYVENIEIESETVTQSDHFC